MGQPVDRLPDRACHDLFVPRLGMGRTTAIWVGLTVSLFAGPLLFYARADFPQPLSAALLVTALYLAVRVRQGEGAAAGLSVWTAQLWRRSCRRGRTVAERRPSAVVIIVDRITVDDASPQRSGLGVMAFVARRLRTRVTPWNFGREMLVIARRGS